MKPTLSCLLLSAIFLVGVSYGQDEDVGEGTEYQVRPIESLDEIQGHWTFVPKGDRGFGGHTLDIKGKKGVFKGVTDTPQKMPNDEVGLELADGALLLKRASTDVPKGKWQLAELGEYKCLFRMASLKQNSPQPHLYVEVLYLHPKADGADVGGDKKFKGKSAKPPKSKQPIPN